MNICTFKKIPQLLQKIHKCTRKQNSNEEMTKNEVGSHACLLHWYDSLQSDISFYSIIIFTFSKGKIIKRLIYQMTSFYQKMLNLEKALTSADLDTLNDQETR